MNKESFVAGFKLSKACEEKSLAIKYVEGDANPSLALPPFDGDKPPILPCLRLMLGNLKASLKLTGDLSDSLNSSLGCSINFPSLLIN